MTLVDYELETELDTDLRRSMLRAMLQARGVDEEATLLQKQGVVDLWLSCRGQEAAQVATALAVDRGAMIVPSYRDHAVALVRGVQPHELVAQWAGKTFCGWDPRAVNMFPYTLVLAAQTLHAVGYAIGRRLQGERDYVVAFIGDGASSEGDMSEALNLAAVESAPVLFVCQNNGWAISKPSSEQMATSLAERARGFGVRAVTVDGQDPEHVYRAATAAVDYIETDRAPYLLELKVARMRGHSTNDAHELYRSAEDIADAEADDPVTAYARALTEDGVVDEDWFAALRAEIAETRRLLAKWYER
ncbi:thiamine pyrophosphate-dependent dehydrogenase E1 component subunit alpha [Nocardia sp. NPDC052566]|uniref:thiamine pyrophosphate-dependent dehydrogenase E1 component subunit alpha n=1 Tax=Nocardia sp. NPDC052566 TaxID=3364330 RepID=UPI0037C76DC1